MGAWQTPAKCGTDSGYYRHVRNLNEPACDACKAAHAAAARARYAGERIQYRPCTTCNGQTRTEHDRCSRCRRMSTTYDGPRPVWVLRGGIWRDANKASA